MVLGSKNVGLGNAGGISLEKEEQPMRFWVVAAKRGKWDDGSSEFAINDITRLKLKG